ncbi:3525_t:CDS:2 [Funneliformis caledonium]|uniref:3525_t:CDS:1 n=1 Tax=Funneliformis caledonium TaxID=1117310 RepID=A0A9N9IQD6_9GLOM|nr:3525_t:CDS:2 [Funneliformis caledonium]
MQTYEEQIKYNDDGSVNVPFGRAAEWYLENVPILKICRLKKQSRQVTPTLVKAEILTVERVQGAADYLEWTTTSETKKSTNCIDDVLVLTSKGNELLTNINLRIDKDRQCCIQGNHNPAQYITTNIPKIFRINLTYVVRDSIVISRRADHRNAKGIKAKILALLNGASEDTISKSLTN